MTQIYYRAPIDRVADSREHLRARLQIASWHPEDFSVVIRWGFTIVAVIGGWVQDPSVATGPGHVAAAVVLGYAVVRSLIRIRPATAAWMATAAFTFDLTLYGVVAFFTGIWSSPYAVCVAGSVALSGLVGGLVPPCVGVAEVVIYRLVRSSLGESTIGPASAGSKILGIFAVGVLGACASQLLKLQRTRTTELRSLRSVNEVHSLLLELHSHAAGEPRWLTLNGTIKTIVGRLRSEIQADLVTLLLRDPTADGLEQHWQVAAAEGLRLPPMVANHRLPGGARQAERQRDVLLMPSLGPGQGLDSRSTSGVYTPLWGRTSLLGILILERRSNPSFSEEDAQVIGEIGRHAGLTIDNTRLFARLRRLGAEVERDRIARELHDGIGQSLVGVGLSVDRLAMALPPDAQDVRRELQSLAADVRGVTRQVREKLTDLRMEPASAGDLPRALAEFLDRVANRSGLAITFDQGPIVEVTESYAHEVWRIAQEAVLNAERHASANHLYVYWGEKGGQSTLIVADDGSGISGTAPLRRDAYGLIGMRERAEVIGASLLVETAAGRGTTIKLRLQGRGQ